LLKSRTRCGGGLTVVVPAKAGIHNHHREYGS
jgi:hypothetical protein